MRMRLKVRRGEKFKHTNGKEYAILEQALNTPDFVRALNENGAIESINKDDLNIPIIETKDYEKIEEERWKKNCLNVPWKD